MDKTGQYNDVIGDNSDFRFNDVRNVSLRDRVELSQLSGNDKRASRKWQERKRNRKNGFKAYASEFLKPGMNKE